MTTYRRTETITAVQFDPDKKPWPEGVKVFEDEHWCHLGRIFKGDWIVDNEYGREVLMTKGQFESRYINNGWEAVNE